MMSIRVDITGQTFNRLTAIKDVGRSKCGRRLWLCECSCGNTKTTTATYLRTKQVKSCGCMHNERVQEENTKRRKYKDPQKCMANALMNTYKYRCRKTGLSFGLTLNEFQGLTTANCHYCGDVPSQIYRQHTCSHLSDYVYNGIDRIDSNKGYVVNNCVSCCKTCNYMKRDMNVEGFHTHINKIFLHRRS